MDTCIFCRHDSAWSNMKEELAAGSLVSEICTLAEGLLIAAGTLTM